jgi:hypothetical protein
MKRFFFVCLAGFAAFAFSGCHFFRKNKKPKENPAIATEVETMFKQRWLAKREAELTAKGSTPEAARQQARTEFNEQYKFTTVAHD